MNVIELNPQGGTATTNLAQYVALAIPFTIVTAWIIIAFQSKYIYPDGTSFVKRLGWPFLLATMVSRKRQAGKFQRQPLASQYDYGGGGDYNKLNI